MDSMKILGLVEQNVASKDICGTSEKSPFCPSTPSNLFPILICNFLIPKEITFRKTIWGQLLRTGPSPVRWGKDKISISDCQQNVCYSSFIQIRAVFEPVQGPCSMNVRNEPLLVMACVVKRETPSIWRLKLCKFQHRKNVSVSGTNLIVWRGLEALD